MEVPHLEGAHIIGSFVSLAAFGFYTCLFIQTCYYMKKASVHSVLISIKLTILWLLTLLSTALQASVIYEAFVTSRDRIDPTVYFALWFKRWQFTVLIILNTIGALLGNTFICWRLCTVWQHNRNVLIAPLTLLLGMAVSCFATIGYEIKGQSNDRHWSTTSWWQLAAVVFTLAVNALVMGMMAWQIWRVARDESGINPAVSSLYQNILQVLIESGVLYAFFVLASVILQAARRTFGFVIVTYMLPNVIGMVPTLIVLRTQTSAKGSRGSGPDTLPTTTHQRSISRPVFAHMATDTATTTTQMSEMFHSSQFKSKDTLENPMPDQAVRMEITHGASQVTS